MKKEINKIIKYLVLSFVTISLFFFGISDKSQWYKGKD